MASETLTVRSYHTPADLLAFRRYKVEQPGSIEAMLDANPGLASDGVFLALGREVVTEIPSPRKTVSPTRVIRLWD